jgi:hypothetical protein
MGASYASAVEWSGGALTGVRARLLVRPPKPHGSKTGQKLPPVRYFLAAAISVSKGPPD